MGVRSVRWGETWIWLPTVRQSSLATLTSDGAMFAHTVRHYNEFGGIVLDDAEGKNICEALGPDGKAVILRNHGIISAAGNVEAAVAYYIRCEELCRAQLEADTAGHALEISQQTISSIFAEKGGEMEATFQAQEIYEWMEDAVGLEYKS
jgi:ribulose-5-phosphate 4-epimerase/fuculose-1-phosphate aldolase